MMDKSPFLSHVHCSSKENRQILFSSDVVQGLFVCFFFPFKEKNVGGVYQKRLFTPFLSLSFQTRQD